MIMITGFTNSTKSELMNHECQLDKCLRPKQNQPGSGTNPSNLCLERYVIKVNCPIS